MSELKKEIGKRLAETRKSKKLKQEDLKEMIGAPTVQMISNWENGHAFPSATYLIILSKKLDVSLDYLLLGKESGTNAKNINTYKDVGECIIRLMACGIFELGSFLCANNRSAVTLTSYDQTISNFQTEFDNLRIASKTLRPELFNQAVIDLLNKYDIVIKQKGDNKHIKD